MVTVVGSVVHEALRRFSAVISNNSTILSVKTNPKQTSNTWNLSKKAKTRTVWQGEIVSY